MGEWLCNSNSQEEEFFLANFQLVELIHACIWSVGHFWRFSLAEWILSPGWDLFVNFWCNLLWFFVIFFVIICKTKMLRRSAPRPLPKIHAKFTAVALFIFRTLCGNSFLIFQEKLIEFLWIFLENSSREFLGIFCLKIIHHELDR